MFGTPAYGGSIQQKLYYANSVLCDESKVDMTEGYPRTKKKENTVWKAPYILMVDRGDCSFVQKVRNAQKVGAAGVIIADSTCLCRYGETCTPDDVNEVCEDIEPIMADDGSGADITVPSFLMFKQDADVIKKELREKNQLVQIEMSWSRLNPTNDKVQYELWADAIDPESAKFLNQFKAAALALQDHILFTPHTTIYDGFESGCVENAVDEYCLDMCSTGGRYCANDPDGDEYSGIQGFDVVKESLRRECLWRIYGKDDGMKWWEYVSNFNEHCLPEKTFTSQDCINNALSVAGVDSTKLSECEEKTGNLYEDTPNYLFDAQFRDRQRSGIVRLPGIYVNHDEVRGTLDFATVFKAVCSGFTSESEPAICNKCAKCNIDEYQCVLNNHCPTDKSSVSVSTFLSWLGGMALVSTIVGLGMWCKFHRQVKYHVRGIMDEYAPVGGDKTNTNSLVESADDFNDEE